METVKASSDRVFGLVFAVLFALIALWPVYDRGGDTVLWAGLLAGLFFVVALLHPLLLAPLNRAWTHFGLLLNRFTSPIILGLLFFVVICPLALLMRLFGKRPLQLSYDADVHSYWIIREPPGPAPETMKQQF